MHRHLCLVVAALAALSTGARAEVVTFRFAGTVTGNGLAAGPFTGAAPGDAAEIVYTFESTTAPIFVSPPPPATPAVALYDGAVTALALTIGSVAVEATMADLPAFRLGVQDSSFDSYGLNNGAVPPDAGFRIDLALLDFTAAALASTDLPTTLDLAAFGAVTWRVFESNPAVTNELTIGVDSFEVVVDEVVVEGDANGDGQVDFDDLVVVILDFGCADPDPCDVNGDGAVDFDDIVVVVVNLCTGVSCDDGDPCTIDTCIFGFCLNVPDPACAP